MKGDFQCLTKGLLIILATVKKGLQGIPFSS
jgi:hypothetical protein